MQNNNKTPKDIDVVGVGNAIVDILAQVDEQFLLTHGVAKGDMTLVDKDRFDAIYNALQSSPQEMSGGSVANSIANISALGGRTGFMGKVGNDDFGKVYKHDLNTIGVDFRSANYTGGLGTGRSLVLITPDAERSMNTYLGASVDFDENSLSEDIIKRARMIFLEGYLFDKPNAKAAFNKAAALAKKYDTRVALTLSSESCVNAHNQDFRDLIESGKIDILIGNMREANALYGTNDLDEAVNSLSDKCQLLGITMGSKGSAIVHDGVTYRFNASQAKGVQDTTGAGDAWAGGLLFGLTQGYDMATAGKLAAAQAAYIVQRIGPRPDFDAQTRAERFAQVKPKSFEENFKIQLQKAQKPHSINAVFYSIDSIIVYGLRFCVWFCISL